MATVIPMRRPLSPEVRLQQAQRKAAAAEHSAERFWRKSMVPVSIAMCVVIVMAVSALVIGLRTGYLGHDSTMWVLVAALVSMVGLTKIVIANMFFFVLMQDDARLDGVEPPPPPTRILARQTRPLRLPPQSISAARPRQPGRGRRVSSLPAD